MARMGLLTEIRIPIEQDDTKKSTIAIRENSLKKYIYIFIHIEPC